MALANRKRSCIAATITGAWLLTGCGLAGYPDRRAAQVVVNEPEPVMRLPSLREPVSLALAWWQLATHDTSAELVGSCDDGDRACTIVSYGVLEHGLYGNTKRWRNGFSGKDGSDITIRPYLDEAVTRIVVAHEIGHSFSMPHVRTDTDLMFSHNVPGDACISEATLRNWAAEYGDNGRLFGACALDVFGLLDAGEVSE